MMRSGMEGYIQELRDPTYMIRAVPSKANDNVYCTLAQSVVHGAITGYTGYTSLLNKLLQTQSPPIVSCDQNPNKLFYEIGTLLKEMKYVAATNDKDFGNGFYFLYGVKFQSKVKFDIPFGNHDSTHFLGFGTEAFKLLPSSMVFESLDVSDDDFGELVGIRERDL
ncbi:hypothetical protein TSUD_144290 [Trifolium subterraneum]|uniref:Uncharacterized protein n=1 Tax=Trifolium subterraneum TaxID=3900 RepID=A0A2Z6MR59_TRISU|nr:hypothetical protein TSUD_144290 [Trifolium subterraneum]